MTWRGLPARIIRIDHDSWVKVMILTAIPYCIFARIQELIHE